MLFFVVQMALALFITNILTSYYLVDESVTIQERQAVYVYFGTFTRSIYSMFEITLARIGSCIGTSRYAVEQRKR